MKKRDREEDVVSKYLKVVTILFVWDPKIQVTVSILVKMKTHFPWYQAPSLFLCFPPRSSHLSLNPSPLHSQRHPGLPPSKSSFAIDSWPPAGTMRTERLSWWPSIHRFAHWCLPHLSSSRSSGSNLRCSVVSTRYDRKGHYKANSVGLAG